MQVYIVCQKTTLKMILQMALHRQTAKDASVIQILRPVRVGQA